MSRPAVSKSPSDWTELVSSIAGIGVLLSDATAPEPSPPERALVAREFPHLSWAFSAAAAQPAALHDAVLIDEADWHSDATDLYDWDARVLSLQSRRGWLLVSSAHGSQPALEALLQILTRYQRLAPRVNDASRDDSFRCAVSLHRALHDLNKPLVRADYEHALDVWQWVLRLEPCAGRALQLAALFHDIERISSEGDQRVEQHAIDYQSFKNAHAWVGAQLAAHTLAAAGMDAADCDHAAELIWQHELPLARKPDSFTDGASGIRPAMLGPELMSPDALAPADIGAHGSKAASDGPALIARELRVLADADALSFFSLNSRGFFDYYGLEHTRKKVRYTLGRMSPVALGYLQHVKLPSEVERVMYEISLDEHMGLQAGAAS